MRDRKKVATLIEDNWDQVKQGIVSFWDKLTEADVNKLTGYDSLVSKLVERYNFTENKLIKEIDSLLERLDLFSQDVHFKELKDALYQSAVASTNKISRNIQASVGNIKNSSSELNQSAITYIREKPIQSMLFAFLGGIVLKSILDRK